MVNCNETNDEKMMEIRKYKRKMKPRRSKRTQKKYGNGSMETGLK